MSIYNATTATDGPTLEQLSELARKFGKRKTPVSVTLNRVSLSRLSQSYDPGPYMLGESLFGLRIIEDIYFPDGVFKITFSDGSEELHIPGQEPIQIEAKK